MSPAAETDKRNIVRRAGIKYIKKYLTWRKNIMEYNTYPEKNIKDCGPKPFIINIDCAAKKNTNYRTVLWTGELLQVTLMSIAVGGDIGTEIHEDTDQFIRIEKGRALIRFGKSEETMKDVKYVCGGYSLMVPAGTWHNIINTGDEPLKVYSIYAPPHHPHGAVQKTKED